MKKIVKKRLMLIIIFLAAFLFVSVSGITGTDHTPVYIRAKTLTMTGVRQPPPAEEPRDYSFTPVKIRTKTLTMTGTRD